MDLEEDALADQVLPANRLFLRMHHGLEATILMSRVEVVGMEGARMPAAVE